MGRRGIATVMTERIQMQNSTYKQNYAVDMSLCQLYQVHGVIAEMKGISLQKLHTKQLSL